MTHSLHRTGTPEDLKKDVVILYMASKGINVEGSGEKFKEYLRLLHKNGAVNLGGLRIGHLFNTPPEELCKKPWDNNSTHNAVFDNYDNLVSFLKDMKEADMGLSLVVTGPYEQTVQACNEVGLKPNAVNHSLGIWGKTEKLTDEDTLIIHKMCGHAMTSPNLIKLMAEKVKKGKDPVEAAKVLAGPCHCALFNVPRAARLLKEMAEKE